MGNETKNVFCAGVWDLGHKGHIKLLEKARKLGNLTVGVVDDGAVQIKKGKSRPIQTYEDRAYFIKSLGYQIAKLDDFSFPKFILENFDYIIVGEDQNHFENLDEIPYEKKIIFPRYPGISTSDIIKKIKEI